MNEPENIINVGILAHVDAGKTTLTENFLFSSGTIKMPGSVDKGTAQTDSLQVEKERGISVKLSSASLQWKDTRINIIDTPGHIDFSTEIDRCLQALDAAILVVSAVEGIQSHAENIWHALKELKIPTMIVINKIDRVGSDVQNLIDEINNNLTNDALPFQNIEGEATDNPIVKKEVLISGKTEEIESELLENIISFDDNILEKYLSGESIDLNLISECLNKAIATRKIIPLLFTSAKFEIGTKDILDFLVKYFPKASKAINEEISGIVYKVEQHNDFGRIASVRLFSGEIKNRDIIYNTTQQKELKVSQIKKLYANKYEDTGIIQAGDTASIFGQIDLLPGDIIGKNGWIKKKSKLSEPVLTIKVIQKDDKNYSKLVKAIQELSIEDPTLDFLWLREEREIHIKVMGSIHIEILQNILKSKYKIDVEFDEPIVIYKETPISTGEGYEEYTLPKPCWAVVKFLVEPLDRGCGVIFESNVGVNSIAQKYQAEIERTIPIALKQGIHGWEVTDLKITLIDGEDHEIHSRPGDFVLATQIGIMQGLKSIGTKILEPILEFKISAPEEYCGKVISHLSTLRAVAGSPEIENGNFKIKGTIPVATSLEFPIKLNSLTGGKGKLSTRHKGYVECDRKFAKTIPYRGISPLDRSKYILKHRGALQ